MFAAFIGSCSDNTESPPQTGTVVVRLTDASAAYEEVHITISDIELSMPGGWVSIKLDTAKTIDLLEWNNGKSIEIGRQSLSPGKVTQIRLTLLRADIRVDGVTYPLDVPSGEQSGLKLNTGFDVVAGVTYELALDFDVQKSIVETGKADYKLKPVIRAVPVATSGSISGIVTNPDNYTVAEARDNQNNVVTTTVVQP